MIYLVNMKLKLIYFLIFFCTFNTNAYAYIDPGLGSIILQGIIAAVAATSLTIKYLAKNKKFF